jgi:hypothetical protein
MGKIEDLLQKQTVERFELKLQYLKERESLWEIHERQFDALKDRFDRELQDSDYKLESKLFALKRKHLYELEALKQNEGMTGKDEAKQVLKLFQHDCKCRDSSGVRIERYERDVCECGVNNFPHIHCVDCGGITFFGYDHDD